MTRWVYAALGLLTMSALAGCAAQTGSSGKNAGSPGGAEKTIVLGVTRLDPENLTMAPTDVLAFRSTASEPLQLEFTQPSSQAGKITCRLADPKSLKPGEKPWATFSQNAEGHFSATVPPGRFLSVCTLAPGAYTYVVHTVSANPMPSEERLGQQGTITVR